MKIANSVCLAGILCLTSAGFSKAGPNDLIGAVSDSSMALQANDLESARDLSGKFVNGSVALQSPSPVQAYSGAQTGSKTKELPALALTAPKKMNLAADVPPPAAQSKTDPDFQKPGFINSLTVAALSLILTPFTGAEAGGTFGKEYGTTHGGKTGGEVGAVIGVIIGFVAGVAIGVVRCGINLVEAVINLCKGKL